MTFQAFTPDPALQPYIRMYWLITGRHENQPPIELLPDGGVSLVINLGEGIHSARFGAQWCEHGALIVGAMTAGDTQMLLGESLLFGITFKPGGFTHLHRYDPLDRVADDVLPFDRSLFANTGKILRHGSRYLDRFYLERVVHPRYSVLPVVNDIEQHQGRLRMDDLMHRHCTTGRQLERQFKQQVGISPKEYIGITRFNHAYGVVQREGHRSLMDIAWECGYYDHAHMTTDFKRRMGRTPSFFVLSDNSKIVESAPQ